MRLALVSLGTRETGMGRFDRQGVLLTGGTGGIGKAIARGFLAEGAQVLALGSNAPRLEVLKQELESTHLATLVLDLRSGADEVRQAVDAAVETLGRIDVLVNCAGVAFQTPILDISEEQWDTTLTVNLKSAFFLSQECARRMVSAGGGAIVNVASIDAFRGCDALYADYCASKAGLAHLTTAMALELGALGVRCNAVAPGPVATPMMDYAEQDPETYRVYTRLVAQRRFSTPEEQARVVLFLASDDASNITGETVRVDGGWMLGMWPNPAAEPEW
jgi:3-oxoacyl-[acyl-carrier protein] reductase